MKIEVWRIIYKSFIFMSYLGVGTTFINLFIKVFIEKRSLKRWFGGELISSFIGFLLFGVSFGIFGYLATDPLEKKLFYHFVVIGALMPIWLDPIFSIKFLMDRQRYGGNPKQIVSVLKCLALFSFLILAILSAEKRFNQDTLLSIKTFAANKWSYFTSDQASNLQPPAQRFREGYLMNNLNWIVWGGFLFVAVLAVRWERRLLKQEHTMDKGMASTIFLVFIILAVCLRTNFSSLNLLWILPIALVFFSLLCRAFPVYMIIDRALHKVITFGVYLDRAPMPHTSIGSTSSYPDDMQWDVFVSYKTEDVEIVRRIANQLIASGLKVWFNEYQVLLQNYNNFQEAINFGISHCERAIVFTNDRYIDSEYCRIEIEQILEKLQPDHILEIMIPKDSLPHKRYPGLTDCIGYIGSDCEGILAFIQKTTPWRIKPLVTDDISSKRVDFSTVCRGRSVSLDISNWEVTKQGHSIGGSVRGLELSCRATLTQRRLLINLFCGPEISDDGQRLEQTKDDRQMFRALMQYAAKHIGRVGGEEFGLHLFFQKELSQFVATYRMSGYWCRKYSITIPNDTTKKMAEFVFTAACDGTFEDYCIHVHLMDSLVKSLRWV